MKTVFKALFIITFSITGLKGYAQEKKMEFSVTAGYANRLPIQQFDRTGNGFHLGANMYKRSAERFTTDAQLSLNFTDLNNSLTNILMVNALYGVRYYFSKLENDKRLFFSVLIGPAFRSESGDDFIENLIDVGYSGGLFVESKKFVFGVSLDAPQSLIFKVGYTF